MISVFYSFPFSVFACYSIYKVIQLWSRKKYEKFTSPEEDESLRILDETVDESTHSNSNYDNIKKEIYQDENLTFVEKESSQFEILDNGNVQISFDFKNSGLPFCGFSKRNGLRIVEKETNTQLIFPRKRPLDGNAMIIITGKEVKHILLSYKTIKARFSSSASVQKILTHFISIPMNVTHLQENFEQFKTRALEICGADRGVCQELFQKKEKLHLTLGVMNLSNKIQKELAFDTLEKCKKRIIEPLLKNEPIVVLIRGIKCMNNNPAKTFVLYGKIEKSEILQRVADEIVEYFNEAGIMDKERKNVLLHLTLMNSKFLRKVSEEAKSKNPQLLEKTFDARNILQNFKNYEFGQVKVETVHLSLFSVVGKDGYYGTSYKIDF